MDPGNYRPISVLPVISKLIERIVAYIPVGPTQLWGMLPPPPKEKQKNNKHAKKINKTLEIMNVVNKHDKIKMNEWGFIPHLCLCSLKWARRTF